MTRLFHDPLRCRCCHSGARLLFGMIEHLAADRGELVITVRELAEMTGFTERHVTRLTRLLERNGHLQVHRDSFSKNAYALPNAA